MEEENLLSVKNLSVSFDHPVIKDLSFTVKKNETLAVIGPNGAGKSVLFRAILGLVPYGGEVAWRSGIKIGYVPQKLSVSRDLPLTTEEFLRLKENNREAIVKVLEELGFKQNEPHTGHLTKHVLKRKLGVLSGGELQKVLIAFALLGGPEILLFDEPTAGVDLSGEETIYSLLHRLQKVRGLSIILISHEPEIVHQYADHVLDMGKLKK